MLSPQGSVSESSLGDRRGSLTTSTKPRCASPHLIPGLRLAFRELYFGGLGVEPAATAAPQCGQWVQVGSSGDSQERQVRGTVEVTVAERAGVEDFLSTSGSAAMPFLNSFMDFPSDLARSGSLFPPKSINTITRITSSSW